MILWELQTKKQQRATVQRMQGLYYNSFVSFAELASMFGFETHEVRAMIQDTDIEQRLYANV